VATQRVSPGGFAITVFIGSAIYLVVGNHGWQTLLTFKAVIFLLLGVFFSVLLVGVPFHLLRGWIEKRCFNVVEVPLAAEKVRQIKMLGTVLMVSQVVVTFYATKLAYGWYFS
jgi:hypothetical protein